MSLRENISKNPRAAAAVAALFVLAAVGLLAHTFWPEKRPRADLTYYSDDDGQSWFTDSVYRLPPFDHNGKTALLAAVFTYDDGAKAYCAYLQRYTDIARQQLQKAIDDAQARGRPPSSVDLFRDHKFISSGTEVRATGANQKWILLGDPRSTEVVRIHSPDGSAVDQLIAY